MADTNPLVSDVEKGVEFILGYLEKLFGPAFATERDTFIAGLEKTAETETPVVEKAVEDTANTAINAEVDSQIPAVTKPFVDPIVQDAEKVGDEAINAEISSLEARIEELNKAKGQ